MSRPGMGRHSCGDGAKGPRPYDWAAARLPAIRVLGGERPTHERWVLDRRSLARPDKIANYLACAPCIADPVRIAGSCGATEKTFQALGGQLRIPLVTT